MGKKSRKKIGVITLVVVIVGMSALFASYNYYITSIIQTQKQTFQTQIKAASEPMQKEDKESQLAAINELKKVEAEITAFQQNVYFTEINSASFKEEKELVTKKVSEACEHINFLYKVKLDANVKDPKTLSQGEIKVIIQELDALLNEIQTDGILQSDVIQTFSDRVNEMKGLYTPLLIQTETKTAVKNEGNSTPSTETNKVSTGVQKPTVSSSQTIEQESTTEVIEESEIVE